MNYKELSSILKANELHVIHIHESPTKDNIIIDGELEDFINSAKILSENTVFVSIRKLEDEDFFYEIGSDDAILSDNIYTEERDIPPIDLSTILPEIRSYKKYLNSEGVFELSIFYKNYILKLYQAEKWWLQFQERIERARDRTNCGSRKRAAREARRREYTKRPRITGQTE